MCIAISFSEPPDYPVVFGTRIPAASSGVFSGFYKLCIMRRKRRGIIPSEIKNTLFAMCIFSLLQLLDLKATKVQENMKKNQPNQTTEEMHKIPNSSENKNISSN